MNSNGVAYLAGTTTSVDFPMAGNSFQTTPAASVVNGFVATIDPGLYGGDSLTYSTYLGGTTGNNTINGIALDSAGFIYLIGTTKSTDFPLTTSGYARVCTAARTPSSPSSIATALPWSTPPIWAAN